MKSTCIYFYSTASTRMLSLNINPNRTISDLNDAAKKMDKKNFYKKAWINGKEISFKDKIADHIKGDNILIFTDKDTLTQEEIDEIYKTNGYHMKDMSGKSLDIPAVSSASKPPGPSKPQGIGGSSKPPGPGGPSKPPGRGRPSKPPGPGGPSKPKVTYGFSSFGPQKAIDFTGNQNSPDLQTAIGFRPSNISISTKNENRPETTNKANLRFFCTATPELFLEGVEFVPDYSWTPNDCADYLLENTIQRDVDIPCPQLLLYLPGGITFADGTLGDYFESNPVMVPQRVLYGVLTRSPSDEAILDTILTDLWNASDDDSKLLISPICDSSDKGLADMACLLGYLNNDGVKGDLLIKTLAAVTHFPPLITSMNRIIEQNEVDGRTVITVMGSLFCYFRYMLPKNVPLDKVFEYGLRCCNIISHIEFVPEMLPIIAINVLPYSEDPSMKLFTQMGQDDLIYFWRGDTGESFKYQNLARPEALAIEQVNNTIASFRPITPPSMMSAIGCSIVAGKDHSFLYLKKSASSERSRRYCVDLVDPLVGKVKSIDIKVFSKEQGITNFVETASLIDPERVKQIVYICLDESGSMKGDLNGDKISKKSTSITPPRRVTIARQYINSFVNRTYGYRIPCIQGFISFHQLITERCPLGPLVPNFDDQALKDISPAWKTNLWDAISHASDGIVSFNKNSKGGLIYQNALNRILVISDGGDNSSTTKPEDLVRKLMRNKIVVDSVIITDEVEECKMLCAISHMTGGYSFCPKTISEGLALFEQSAFLSIEERHKPYNEPIIGKDRDTTPAKLKLEKIDADFLGNATKNAQFDTQILNRDISLASSNTRFATPRHVIFKNANTNIPYPRQRRILRELHAIAEITDKENIERFNPDIVAHTFQANLDRWIVYIRGTAKTSYADKWWSLLITFPDLYPVEPPVFRFITIPYHINVSSEGRICLNAIERGYISSKSVIDIILEIKGLFLFPCEETPIQIEKYITYMQDKDHKEYEMLARESTEKNPIKEIDDFLKGKSILDEIPSEFKVDFNNDNVPDYMKSQIAAMKK